MKNPNRTWTQFFNSTQNPNKTKPLSSRDQNRTQTQNFGFFPISKQNLKAAGVVWKILILTKQSVSILLILSGAKYHMCKSILFSFLGAIIDTTWQMLYETNTFSNLDLLILSQLCHWPTDIWTRVIQWHSYL